ncbi:maleylpyruvate isomerase N-terminal domain-containing protein [Streptomyces griseus]|uniref:maleylpyruvate isomerase N-terminal domain-containing protein n=1 Tax=Streptomyces griseus TaxID=1911 RepID=UPI0004C80E8A|nr:maleylpyruvate isomerase N-terminal domain-containing protein [Streptomyces griseus]
MHRYDLLYRESLLRIEALVGPLDEERLGLTVPACPLWRVSDLVAHLAGVAHDFTTGRLDGKPGPMWTRRHVRERSRRGVRENLGELRRLTPAVEELLSREQPEITLLHDIVQHEADLRGCLPGTPAVPTAVWELLLDDLCGTASAWVSGPGPLLLRSGGREWKIPGGEAHPTTLDAPGHDLWRAIFGRRSTAQMSAWNWSGTAEPYLRSLPRFPARETDLTEPGPVPVDQI